MSGIYTTALSYGGGPARLPTLDPGYRPASAEDSGYPGINRFDKDVSQMNLAAIREPGSALDHHDQELEQNGHEKWLELGRVAFVAAILLLVWFRAFPRLHGVDLAAWAGLLIGGYPIFKEAVSDLLDRRMTMELSMTIALVAAAAIGELFTALLIALFVLIAEILEDLTVGRGRRAIRNLLDLLPSTAEVRSGSETAERNLSEIVPGDLIVVRPGARIPVDGIVASGNSFADQSAITGESMPVEKAPGASVFAGTINQSGLLEIRAEKVGRETAFGRIIEAVERAERSRAPIQRIADRLAGYLVYFALGCAALTFLVTHNARSTISVIVVAGACGIAAGTPLAILGAIGRAARHGAIVKGGLYLEVLSAVDTIVLDKTGTLTLGTPEIFDVHVYNGGSPADVMRIAATAERFSEHPLAKAIVRKAQDSGLPLGEPAGFRYSPGKGVICEVDGRRALVGARALLEQEGVEVPDHEAASARFSEVMVAWDGRLLGSIRIADVLRSEAAEAIREMKRLRLATVLLTGDRREVAEAAAKELGVDEVYSELLPDQKVDRIRDLRSQGRIIAMVGDGVNDAPALMEANVGVAMGSGTDVAKESASVVLLGNDLLRFAEVLQIARRARAIIMANFVGTLAVDAAGMLLAALGLLNPVLAALVHVSSELLFILNSARLLPRSPKKDTSQPPVALAGAGV
jgi:heavy metal translocating P-type ATPase